MTNKLFYITGREGSLEKGLAAHLSTLSDDFQGLAVDLPFLRQRPLIQIEQVQQLLRQYCDRTIIANSYGAYLTLQALVDFDVVLPKVILLSPVLGAGYAKDRMYMSKPPFTKRLRLALEEQRLAVPKAFSMYIGDDDPLYDPSANGVFNRYFGEGTVTVLPGEGHMISRQMMDRILDGVVNKA